MVKHAALSLALLAAACERSPNYHAGVPGGSSDPAPPVPQVPRGPVVPPSPTAAASAQPAASMPAASPAAPATARVAEQTTGPSPAGEMPANGRAQTDQVPAAAQSFDSPKPTFDDNRPVASPEALRAHARDRRFDQIRGISERFRKLRAEMRALGIRLVDGGGSDADRARYMELDRESMQVEMPRILDYMQDPKWTPADRAAMTLIIYNADS